MLTFHKSEMLRTVLIPTLLPPMNPAFGKSTELVPITFYLYTMSVALSMQMSCIDISPQYSQVQKNLIFSLSHWKYCDDMLNSYGHLQRCKIVFLFML